MATKEDFDAAVERVNGFSSRPGNDDLLTLYALFKQATSGDVSGKRPGVFDVKGRAKYDAWAKQSGRDMAEARADYVALVESLAARHA